MAVKFNNRRRLFVFAVMLVIFSAAVIYFSPYQSHKAFAYKLVQHTIEIDAPVETVFQFLGNSANASQWSVFVNHITALNESEFADGVVGSRRRCFCNADEKGRQWDELITENMSNTKRQLEIYNLQEFPMTANHLATEQLYKKISNNKSSITFTVFFTNAKPSFAETIKMYIAAYRIKSIFKKNMFNIKQVIEKKKYG